MKKALYALSFVICLTIVLLLALTIPARQQNGLFVTGEIETITTDKVEALWIKDDKVWALGSRMDIGPLACTGKAISIPA